MANFGSFDSFSSKEEQTGSYLQFFSSFDDPSFGDQSQSIRASAVDSQRDYRSKPDVDDEELNYIQSKKPERKDELINQQEQQNQEGQQNNSISSKGGAPIEEHRNDAILDRSRESFLGITESDTGNWLELSSLAKDVSKKVKQGNKKQSKEEKLLNKIIEFKKVWLKITTLHSENNDFNDDIQRIFCSLREINAIKLDFTGFSDNEAYGDQITERLEDLLIKIFAPDFPLSNFQIKTLEVIWEFIFYFDPPNAASVLINYISRRLPSLSQLTDFRFSLRYTFPDFPGFLGTLRAIEQNLTNFELDVKLNSTEGLIPLNIPRVTSCILKFTIWDKELDPNNPQNRFVQFIADSLRSMDSIKDLELEIISNHLHLEALRPIFAVIQTKRGTLKDNLRLTISCPAGIKLNERDLQLKRLIKCVAQELTNTDLRNIKIGIDRKKFEERKNKSGKTGVLQFLEDSRKEVLPEN